MDVARLACIEPVVMRSSGYPLNTPYTSNSQYSIFYIPNLNFLQCLYHCDRSQPMNPNQRDSRDHTRPESNRLSPTHPAPPSPNIYSNQTPFLSPTQPANPMMQPYSSTSALPYPGSIESPVPPSKVAIPRISAPTTYRGRRRSPRACKPCRQRKIKCDGNRPTCGQCAYHKNSCIFEDVKRVRDQKMLEVLSQQVERYEKLLRTLEEDVDVPTSRKIRKALKVREKS